MTDQLKMQAIEAKLLEVLEYEPQSGALRWKVDVSKRIKAGQPVGNTAGNGRVYLQVEGYRFLAHRAVWFIHYGRWPKENLSARNGDYTDLRIDNFEEVDAQQTALKGGSTRPGKSGVPGVAWDGSRKKWVVKIVRGYEHKHIGRFDDLEEAKAAHAKASEEWGLSPTRLSDKASARKLAVNAKMRAKQRVVWKRTLTNAGGVTGWASFSEFVKDLGSAEPTGFVLLPVDASKPVGPGNFRWAEAPSKVFDRTDKASVSEYRKRYRAENPALEKHRSLFWNFGISLGEYQKMLVKQKGVCAICGNPETDTHKGKVRTLSVDHCHDSGKIRDLLCRGCNQGIGNFKEDIHRLVNAIAYLQKHQSKSDDDNNVVPFTKT